MDKPFASLQTLADYMITGYWNEVTDPNGLGYPPHHFDHKVISYTFAGLDGPNAQAQRDTALQAMQMWSGVADVSFVEAALSFDADIYFSNQGDGSNAFTSLTFEATAEGSRLHSAAVVVTKPFFDGNGTSFGSKSLQSYVHELGHALGLGHTGPYNVDNPPGYNPSYQADARYANDTRQYSVMSYFDQSNFGTASNALPSTPQMADILAIQALYGAALTRPGNTTYGGPGSNAGPAYDFANYAFTPTFTIYDSDGLDMLDVSQFNADQIVNLEPGSWSSVAGLKNNLGIWLLTVIENAAGGGGRDALRGNGAANLLDGGPNNDTLLGLGGDDLLRGGAGDDTLLGGEQDDTLEGGAGADELDGGSGSNTASYVFSLAPVIVRLWFQQGLNNDADGDRYAAIQNVIGSLAGDELAGDEFGNRLDGSYGNDTLIGLGGADELIGGPGFDTADYTDSAAAVSVFLLLGVALGGSAHGNLLSGVEAVRGSSHADRLFGDLDDNLLEGRAGPDSLFGDAGWDTLDGGEGFDQLKGGPDDDTYVLQDTTPRRIVGPLGLVFFDITYDDVAEVAGGGIDNVQIRRVASGPWGYTLPDQVENANVVGGGTFDVTGNALDNQLAGNAGVNWLDGGDGADTLKGGGGDDRLTGGPGPDVFLYGFGDGTDTVTDFDKAGGDRLDVRGVPGVHGIDDIPLAQQGPDTIISFGSGFVLLNVQASTLTAQQFIFNAAPTAVHLSHAAVDENSAAGTRVGTLSVDDPDTGDSVSFTLVDDASGRFALDGTHLVVNGALDHEAAATRQIVVHATDAGGNRLDAALTITIGDVNEAPTGIQLNGQQVLENSAPGSEVGTLTAIDPDSADSWIFELADSAGGRVAIDGDRLVVAGSIDFEHTPTLSVTVRVSDSGGLTKDEQFELAVGNVPGVTIVGSARADWIQVDRSAPGQPRPTDEEDSIRGGDGSDRIDARGGNDSVDGGAGADWIAGGAGDDWLKGGGGADRFQFGPGFGHDRIADFAAKGSGHDFIAFDRVVFADFEAVLAASRQQGSVVIIEDAAGNSLTLVGVLLESLRPVDFDFSG